MARKRIQTPGIDDPNPLSTGLMVELASKPAQDVILALPRLSDAELAELQAIEEANGGPQSVMIAIAEERGARRPSADAGLLSWQEVPKPTWPKRVLTRDGWLIADSLPSEA